MTNLSSTRSCSLEVLAPLLVLFLAAVPGCQQGTPRGGVDQIQKQDPKSACGPGAQPDRPYYRGTRQMQQDIRDLFARVPTAAPHQWTDISRKLIAFGERAVPQLVANLTSQITSVRLMSAYVLGMIKDPRSLRALQMATNDSDEQVRYEAATAMVRIGDRRGLLPMINALEHQDPLVRARAILVLREGTGETMGFKPDDHPRERSAAVARWRAWWNRTGGTARG